MPLEELQKDCAFQTAMIHICGDKVGCSYTSSVVVLCRTVRFWEGRKRWHPLAEGSLGYVSSLYQQQSAGCWASKNGGLAGKKRERKEKKNQTTYPSLWDGRETHRQKLLKTEWGLHSLSFQGMLITKMFPPLRLPLSPSVSFSFCSPQYITL